MWFLDSIIELFGDAFLERSVQNRIECDLLEYLRVRSLDEFSFAKKCTGTSITRFDAPGVYFVAYDKQKSWAWMRLSSGAVGKHISHLRRSLPLTSLARSPASRLLFRFADEDSLLKSYWRRLTKQFRSPLSWENFWILWPVEILWRLIEIAYCWTTPVSAWMTASFCRAALFPQEVSSVFNMNVVYLPTYWW